MAKTTGNAAVRCTLCGNPLVPRSGRGAPATMCAPATGRPCRELNKRLQAVARLSATVIAQSPTANRDKTIHRLRSVLKVLRSELVPES